MNVFVKPKTILITGATSGIGYEAVLQLLRLKNRLLITCRNQSRVESLINSLLNDRFDLSDINSLVSFPIVDLSNLDSINKFVEELLKKECTLDTLVLNAGLQYTGAQTVRRSVQKIELTFAVNHLSHHYLAQKLLPLLLKSKSPRIVITSSEVHNPKSPGGKIGKKASLGKLEGLKNSPTFLMIDGNTFFSADKAYKDTKLCNILLGKELSRRLSLKNIHMPVICWAPGLVIPRSKEGFFRYSRKYNEIGQILFSFFARDLFKITESPKKAGYILMSISTSDKYNEKRFRYISNKIERPGKMVLEDESISEEANDECKAKQLWDLSNKTIDRFLTRKLF